MHESEDHFEYHKIMEDTYGDEILVDVEEGSTEVYAQFGVNDRLAGMALTPKKARKLARRLIVAAWVAEQNQ